MVLYPKLEGKLAENDLSRKDIGELLHITPAAVGNKLNGKREFSLDEAKILSSLLDVPVEELFRKREEGKP